MRLEYDSYYLSELSKQFSYQPLPISNPRLKDTFECYTRLFKRYAEARIYSNTKPLSMFGEQVGQFEGAMRDDFMPEDEGYHVHSIMNECWELITHISV